MKVKRTKRIQHIKDYDEYDTTTLINRAKSLKFEDLRLKLPEIPPTQVVSIRLPSELVNELRAIGSQQDVPYQALIKLFLSQAVTKFKGKVL